jgi:hypothetical protein
MKKMRLDILLLHFHLQQIHFSTTIPEGYGANYFQKYSWTLKASSVPFLSDIEIPNITDE